MAQLVPDTYAAALFEIAVENGDVAKLYDDYTAVVEAFKQTPDFYEIYNTPKISKLEKKQVVDAVFKGKIDPLLLNYLKVLIDKRRTNCIKPAFSAFEDMFKYHQNLAQAVVTSVVPLTAAQTEQLTAKLSKLTGRAITIENEIDPALVGGLMIRIGDRIIDNSVRSKIVDLKEMLIERVV